MQTSRRVAVDTLLAVLLALFAAKLPAAERGSRADSSAPASQADRSPVDLALSPDGDWLVTANETSDSVSLVNVRTRQVVDEVRCGDHPADILFCPDGETVLVSCMYSGEVAILKRVDEGLQHVGAVHVGFQPCGIAVTPDGRRAFIGLVASAQVAEIDIVSQSLVRKIAVGNWPRYLTLSKGGDRLAVGCSGDGRIFVVDTVTGEPLYDEPLTGGLNLGHMVTSADGTYAYFTWMLYRTNPINHGNIRRGWVLASRIGRVRFDGPSYREAISLDVPGKAVADPHGIMISNDKQRLVASASGTHELLVYRLPDLPFVGIGGPGDLIDRRLEHDRERFNRIDVGGRPMGLQIAGDNRTVYVANYLRNSIQSVDIESREVIDEISLGPRDESSLARQGAAIFYDAQRSLDQWYSCHSCHQNGGVNSRPMDTMNDGTEMTLKTVLPLYHLRETAPWTWHGWQHDLSDAMHKSFTSTMQGKAPSEDEATALITFLDTLEPPPNPFRNSRGELSAAAKRGQVIFESSKAGCAECHHGPHFTDGKIHDVGLGSDKDRYDGYNTPSLSGVYLKTRFLHSGRARTLERVVTELHSPTQVSGEADLSEQEVADLIEYLRSL